ncbi:MULTISPECIES: hypothetical protein [Donghicola]|nr:MULTISPECIES: hypothetical protein [Donghicola]MCT4579559.1 hypothetical protein [Donghicola sp.]
MRRIIMAAVLSCLATATFAAKPPQVKVVRNDVGGVVQNYAPRIVDYIRAGTKVKITGDCKSACTMYLALDQNLCFDNPNVTLHFHAVSAIFPPTTKASDRMTKGMVLFYPPEIQNWFWQQVGLRNYYGAKPLTAAQIIRATGNRYSYCS